MPREDLLRDMYTAMLTALGPSHWWPATTPFEVAVGAILTQNTNWRNVEKAIGNLKAAGMLSPEGIRNAHPDELAECIRPSGYFRMKANRLKDFVAFLGEECDMALTQLRALPLDSAREALLGVRGIGPETADSILLYALEKPSFVVDAYTRRILTRHALLPEDVLYDEMRDFFMDVLDPDVPLYNEFHALLVRVAATYCLKNTQHCTECPLAPFLP